MAIISSDVSEQTQQILKNISKVLNVVDSSICNVLLCDVYLSNIADRTLVETILLENIPADRDHFLLHFLQISGLPRGAKVEILMICYTNSSELGSSLQMHTQRNLSTSIDSA